MTSDYERAREGVSEAFWRFHDAVVERHQRDGALHLLLPTEKEVTPA